jgi:hypothetical protein
LPALEGLSKIFAWMQLMNRARNARIVSPDKHLSMFADLFLSLAS